MNNRRKRQSSQSHYQIRIPPDLAPENALEVVVGLCQEMRLPINKIEDWATLLADPESTDMHEKAVQEVLLWVDGLRYILNIVYAYDRQRLALREDQHDDSTR